MTYYKLSDAEETYWAAFDTDHQKVMKENLGKMTIDDLTSIANAHKILADCKFKTIPSQEEHLKAYKRIKKMINDKTNPV